MTSMFHVESNSDRQKISNWVLQWRMKFNLDSDKRVQEVHFSKKTNEDVYNM